MNKRGLTTIICMMTLLILGFSSAYSVSPTIPSSISLNCDESYNQEFTITPESGEAISLTPMVISDDNMQMAITYTSSTNHFYLSLFQTSNCIPGDKQFSFKINDDVKNIGVNVSADLFELGSITLSEGRSMDIGGKIEFSVLTSGDDTLRYMIECETSEEGILDVGESYDVICSGESFRFELEDSFSDLDASIIKVFSSESGYAITKTDTDLNNAECILGIDTLGAKVKRGNIFAIKTINSNNNHYVDVVSVTVLDQTGDESPISGVSSNIGFFSERLAEEYEQDIIVQLEKEGCEPYTNVILFESSYSDYIEDKTEEELSKTLKLDMDSLFIMGQETTATVTNLKGAAIETAVVKLTKPDDTTFEIITSESGLIKFTPEVVGLWKIQVTKDNYETSDLYEVQSISGEYDIIALVDGDETSRFEKGDKIVFELRDSNDSIVTLDVEAEYGNDKVEFVQGISEEVDFVSDYELTIPEINGYDEEDYKTRKVEGSSNFIYWILGIAVILIIFVVVSRAKGANPGKKKVNKMEVQLGTQN